MNFDITTPKKPKKYGNHNDRCREIRRISGCNAQCCPYKDLTEQERKILGQGIYYPEIFDSFRYSPLRILI